MYLSVFVYTYLVFVQVCVCARARTHPLLVNSGYVFHYSEYSDSVTYSCAAAAPEAPPTPECVDIGVRHVTLRWSSPDDNGGDILLCQLNYQYHHVYSSCHNQLQT